MINTLFVTTVAVEPTLPTQKLQSLVVQSTPDNSNLQGKQKEVRVIEGKII